MRIIDEDGMILGKVNIIDLTVLLFFGILLFTGYKYLYLKNFPQNILDQVVEEPVFGWINVTAKTGLPPIVYDAINIGDEMKKSPGPFEENLSVVLKKEQIGDRGEEENMLAEITYAVYVKKATDGYHYQETQLMIGQEFLFYAKTYSIRGIIIKIEE